MSAYTVTIRLGPYLAAPTHTWTVNSGAAADPAATSQVLDGLSIWWAFPENDPYPGQPDPQQATLSLLLDDVDQLADIGNGDVGFIEVRSGGALVAGHTGRIAAMSAVPVRRNGAYKALVSLQLVDLLVDLAEIKLTDVWPAESAADRQTRIANAILTAARARGMTGMGLHGSEAIANVGGLAAVTLNNTPARDLLNEFYRQVMGDAGDRQILRAVTTIDPAVQLGPFTPLAFSVTRASRAVYPPGVVALAGHTLDVALDPAGTPSVGGLVIGAGRVEESGVGFVSLKSGAVRTVTVSGDGFGTVVADNGQPASLVDRALSAPQLLDTRDALTMARAVLPAGSSVLWALDAFVWRPTDTDLAGLDFPLTVPTYTPAFPAQYLQAYSAPVVLDGLPAAANPGAARSFYAGTLAAARVTIKDRTLTVSGRIARRLVTGPTKSLTIADVAANFPTVKLKTGTDVVAPALSIYETRLARKM